MRDPTASRDLTRLDQIQHTVCSATLWDYMLVSGSEHLNFDTVGRTQLCLVQARAECYIDFADHLASWGYTVVQPNLGLFFKDFVLPDKELVRFSFS